ncbi:hypothetical protein MBT84_30385 [Streptomyces sp. MBT84]|nr:hypothetical protein [Streptomyces sp. MBT84]
MPTISHVTEFTAWLTESSTAMSRCCSRRHSQSALVSAVAFCSGTALRISEYVQ